MRFPGFSVCLLSSLCCVGRAAWASDPAPPDSLARRTLTLSSALRRTLSSNPELAAAGLRVQAREARRRDAGRRLNPVVQGSLENFGGSLGDSRHETSLTLEQTIELGGDRGARASLARAELDQSAAARARLERDALGETADRFLEAWLLQERVRSLSRAERLADEAIEAAERRFRAGAAPIVERVRAEGTRTQRMIDRMQATADLQVARQRLALMWGADATPFDSLALDAPGSPPSAAHPATSVEVQEATAERVAAESRLEVARATRVPDLALVAGARRLEEAHGTGWIASVGLPLPLWNRQSDNLAAADADLRAARLDEQATTLRVQTTIRLAAMRVESLAATYDTLRTRLVPGAEQSLRLVRDGYGSGRFGYLELLDAQRAVLEAQLAVNEAKAELWRARLEYERLVGAPLEPRNPSQEDR